MAGNSSLLNLVVMAISSNIVVCQGHQYISYVISALTFTVNKIFLGLLVVENRGPKGITEKIFGMRHNCKTLKY